MSECIHKYRRDVETCSACDADEAEAARDAWRELALALSAMLAIYRSGNHHRAGPVEERIEAAQKKLRLLGER